MYRTLRMAAPLSLSHYAIFDAATKGPSECAASCAAFAELRRCARMGRACASRGEVHACERRSAPNEFGGRKQGKLLLPTWCGRQADGGEGLKRAIPGRRHSVLLREREEKETGISNLAAAQSERAREAARGENLTVFFRLLHV